MCTSESVAYAFSQVKVYYSCLRYLNMLVICARPSKDIEWGLLPVIPSSITKYIYVEDAVSIEMTVKKMHYTLEIDKTFNSIVI